MMKKTLSWIGQSFFLHTKVIYNISKPYLVAECWSARIMVSRHEVRLKVRDREASHRDFKSARSYLHIER